MKTSDVLSADQGLRGGDGGRENGGETGAWREFRAAARALSGPIGTGAALSLGVMTGFFFAFSNPTMMGFKAVDAETYIAAMQAINVAVRNLPFFIAFAAPLPLALLAALIGRPRWPWLAAAVCYAAAVAVTRAVNSPINDAMALGNPAAPPENWAEIRDRWTDANHLRGVLAGLGATLALIGVRRAGDKRRQRSG